MNPLNPSEQVEVIRKIAFAPYWSHYYRKEELPQDLKDIRQILNSNMPAEAKVKEIEKIAKNARLIAHNEAHLLPRASLRNAARWRNAFYNSITKGSEVDLRPRKTHYELLEAMSKMQTIDVHALNEIKKDRRRVTFEEPQDKITVILQIKKILGFYKIHPHLNTVDNRGFIKQLSTLLDPINLNNIENQSPRLLEKIRSLAKTELEGGLSIYTLFQPAKQIAPHPFSIAIMSATPRTANRSWKLEPLEEYLDSLISRPESPKP